MFIRFSLPFILTQHCVLNLTKLNSNKCLDNNNHDKYSNEQQESFQKKTKYRF
jgi:hypothetical protein